jgi:hypothetical protein
MTFDKSNMKRGLCFMNDMEVRGNICKGVMYDWDMDMLHQLDH